MRIPHLIASLAATVLLATAGCVLADDATPGSGSSGDSVPLLEFGGRPVVEAFLNGRGPYRFIVDTGAHQTVVDSGLAQELGLGHFFPSADLRIGGITLKSARLEAMPLASLLRAPDAPRGVLSASAFPGALVTFDFPSRRLVVRPGSLPPEDGRSVFAYEAADLPSLPLQVATREISVHLDTGSPFAVSLPTRYMKELPLGGPAMPKGVARTAAGESPIFIAPIDAPVRVGAFALATHELRFSDVVPESGATPRGQLGPAALRDFAVTLDAANHRIRLEKAPSTLR